LIASTRYHHHLITLDIKDLPKHSINISINIIIDVLNESHVISNYVMEESGERHFGYKMNKHASVSVRQCLINSIPFGFEGHGSDQDHGGCNFTMMIM
jgi:hypothetical protein